MIRSQYWNLYLHSADQRDVNIDEITERIRVVMWVPELSGIADIRYSWIPPLIIQRLEIPDNA